MKISKLLTDEAVLVEIGLRILRRRLDLQLTQAELAEQAGIAKRTVERIEAGASAQMSSMIRVLRVLELLPGLDSLIPQQSQRPMDLLKRKGKVRQRASSRRQKKHADEPWRWGEEK
ncbi:MAG: helix-turn-helix domain-containing protein [Candidatus Thiodiazotropha sp. (ex Dulcina madagascariensis)]|nr:helix-turn-helix domain-containing protein [Candidatus Thiodiazotropha sp. (ex Dulcina madagascariensis)]MCU7928568.1 helix-turn-helix domain-containing protein [Candidatus Thiodiazotropha sp. (ex Dulcina madagascariensis)]